MGFYQKKQDLFDFDVNIFMGNLGPKGKKCLLYCIAASYSGAQLHHNGSDGQFFLSFIRPYLHVTIEPGRQEKKK